MTTTAIEQLSPLASDVRAESPDRYMATLFAPPAARHALFALYAFDQEMARVHTVVREPMAGLIRLQWWQDVIDNFGHGDAVAHPVVRGLQHAVIDDGLDPSFLTQVIDGRRRPYEEDLAPSPAAFERYLLDVGGGITGAAAALLNAGEGEARVVVERIGYVQAVLEQLRRMEAATAEQRLWLPEAWTREDADRVEGSRTSAMPAELLDRARAALDQARQHSASVPRSLLPVLFPGTLAGLRLQPPIRTSLRSPLPGAIPRLVWCWLRGRF